MNRSLSFRSGRGWVPGLGLAALAAATVSIALASGSAGFGWPDASTDAGRMLWALRVNRLLTGFIVGSALATSGVILQALLRNPLADPYVLGVSSGAGLGAAVAVLGGAAAAGIWILPGAAFLGGVTALAVVYALARAGRGGVSIFSLLLSGVIVSAMASSLLMLAVSLAPAEGMHSVLWWMLGNVQMAPPALLAIAGTLTAAGTLAAARGGRSLNALSLGDVAAHHLGVPARSATAAWLATAALLTAAAVAVAGMVGFVGLLVPHAARAWFGPDHRRLPVRAAGLGGLFLVACDTLARAVAEPREIPIGVVTALLGGPFFLHLLIRRRREGWVE